MTISLKVYIVTWNAGDIQPPQDVSNLLKLESESLPDIYAIGLQEMKSGWMDITHDALYDDPWTNKISTTLYKRGFVKLDTVRLLGIHESLYIKREHLHYVTNIETGYTRTGFGGYWGNKGGESIRMSLYGVSVCFVNCHFQAHRYSCEARIQDYMQMIEGQRFRDHSSPTILDHDYVFWFGDLNFRLDKLSRNEVLEHIREKDYDYLVQHDQLRKAVLEKKILVNFEEGELAFNPTYKYDYGTNDYDTSKKQRVPAWCDRILWRVSEKACEKFRAEVKLNVYSDLPSYTDSDHKPVIADFTIQVLNNPPPLPVQFDDVNKWWTNRDAVLHYRIAPDRILPSLWDWIGLYRNDFTHMNDYISYIYLPPQGTVQADGSTLYEAKFPGSKLQMVPGVYQLAFFSYHQGCLVGYSDPFDVLGIA